MPFSTNSALAGDCQNPAASGASANVTVVGTLSSGDVADSQFTVPAGYKQVESDMKKMLK